MKQLVLAFAIAVVIFSSCSKDDGNEFIDPNTVDHFSFGTAYGMCIGDCARFYAIANHQLYADTIKRYFVEPLGFSSTPLPDVKYQLAKQLLDSFPTYLLNHVDSTYGCPDCSDQGGVHLQMKQNGTLRTWHIDNFTQNQPVEIRNYINKVKVVLNQL
jgi:hypothetical protein